MKHLTGPGDLVVLGYQLDTYARKLFEKYKENRILAEFVQGYTRGRRPKLRWVFDDQNSAVAAYSGGVLVFFSRKFQPHTVPELLQAGGFQVLLNENDESRNVSILLARRG